ncbi:MgtC/SapB family protein [Ancylomarina sp. 16SWW S1-10-2]|uniref:MgtC/SapB family protein n=1 Tax=Ancylomarina sp. 16SWW S1-10-2 TaxID=2499681 RepID=UPI0012AD7EFA|nr:MgtC/SapB family protein [Ancylomarina sp. 16SWW S1-10-2]MRT93489.1 MgtC/SapB family protein [Ancylomarina sp. 16SWW S1-10-2]
MSLFEEIINEKTITTGTVAFRMLLSLAVSVIVGIEREYHKQPAGLRTHVLISLGATLIMLLSIYIPQTFTQYSPADPARLAAQVVSGIGFLGAGAIMKFGFNVKGLTTAASIWVIAAIGLAIGAGMYLATAIAAGILLFALSFLNIFEKWMFPAKSIKHLHVYSAVGFELKTDPILTLLKKNQVNVQTIDIEQSFDEKRTNLYFVIQIKEKVKINKLSEEIGAIEGVQKVKLQQIV